MKFFILLSACLSVAIAADFNLNLLQQAEEIRQNAGTALKFLKEQNLVEDEKTLKENLNEMNDLAAEMKEEKFRERPVYQMETKLLAVERALVFEVRQALFRRSHHLIKRAKEVIGKVNDAPRVDQIKEHAKILKDLFEKMNAEVDYPDYIELERLTIEHQNKLETLL